MQLNIFDTNPLSGLAKEVNNYYARYGGVYLLAGPYPHTDSVREALADIPLSEVASYKPPILEEDINYSYPKLYIIVDIVKREGRTPYIPGDLISTTEDGFYIDPSSEFLEGYIPRVVPLTLHKRKPRD